MGEGENPKRRVFFPLGLFFFFLDPRPFSRESPRTRVQGLGSKDSDEKTAAGRAAGERAHRTRALSGVSQERTSTDGLSTSSFESFFSSFLAFTKQHSDAFSSPSLVSPSWWRAARPRKEGSIEEFFFNDINVVASRKLDGWSFVRCGNQELAAAVGGDGSGGAASRKNKEAPSTAAAPPLPSTHFSSFLRSARPGGGARPRATRPSSPSRPRSARGPP